jgi:hypothetical protein
MMRVASLLIVAALVAGPAIAQNATPQDRNSYGVELQRALLSRGIDLQVAIRPKPTSELDKAAHFPQLHLYGFINRADVYQLIKASGVLAGAQNRKFRSVEFFDRGGVNGRWVFDLTGNSPPPCDTNRRLCL